jgi:hypothetical protein
MQDDQQPLSVREKFLVLLYRVRESGLFNMATETMPVATHAHCFGVFAGLLRFPDDYCALELLDLPAIYTEYIQMDSWRAARYAKLAHTMLPFAVDMQRALRRAFFVMRWIGKEEYRRRLQQDHALAETTRERETRWVPQLKMHHRGAPDTSDREQLDLAYGVARFAHFIASPGDRAQLADAVEREFNGPLDLSHLDDGAMEKI